MQTAPYVQAIQGDLAAAAALGDDATAEAGRRLSQAVETSLHLCLLDVLTEVDADLSSQLSSGRVDVRLADREQQLVVVDDEHLEAPAPPAPEDGGTARITLR